jgi:hypothetical protein
MITQPIALLLAEKLEQQFPLGTAQHYLDGEAAAELRRLSAQTDNDTALLRQALEALEFESSGYCGGEQTEKALTALRERLEVKT